MIFLNFLMLTIVEMSDWHPIVSWPIISKYKYKLASRKLLVSIYQLFALFTNLSTELKNLVGIMI